jgi:hypothetical protein
MTELEWVWKEVTVAYLKVYFLAFTWRDPGKLQNPESGYSVFLLTFE